MVFNKTPVSNINAKELTNDSIATFLYVKMMLRNTDLEAGNIEYKIWECALLVNPSQ